MKNKGLNISEEILKQIKTSSIKKDMDVDFDNKTIYIENIGDIDIDIIKKAYNRIKQLEAINKAKVVKHCGRPKLVVPDDFNYYCNLVDNKEMSLKEALTKLKISRASYYRIKKAYKEE